MRAAAGIAVGIAVAGGAAGGCGASYEAVLDSLPIVLQRAPLGAPAASGLTGDGALYVMASPPDAADRAGQSFPMLVDTGTPLTLTAGAVPATQTETVGFDLLDPMPPPPAMGPAVRATFRGVSVLRLPLE